MISLLEQWNETEAERILARVLKIKITAARRDAYVLSREEMRAIKLCIRLVPALLAELERLREWYKEFCIWLSIKISCFDSDIAKELISAKETLDAILSGRRR